MEAIRPTVLVTGGTGFIAGHVVEELLNGGYNVRATVREPSPDDPAQQFLRDMQAVSARGGAALEIVKMNLMNRFAVEQACAGVQYVVHVASPTAQDVPPDRVEKALVRPAVQGTLHVLESALRAGVRRVVITSSVAVVRGPEVGRRAPFTEADENALCSPPYGAYAYSQTRAQH